MVEQSFERIPTAITEKPSVPERSNERAFERLTEVAAPRPTQRIPVRQSVGSPRPVSSPLAAPAKSETLLRIEHVMEDRLQTVFREMPPDVKIEFKRKGEQTATEIEALMYKVKVQSKKIFHLLFAWLRMIPGVNQYFLEQEAKLKTDELLHMKAEMEHERLDSALL
jgi:hypothetical protein